MLLESVRFANPIHDSIDVSKEVVPSHVEQRATALQWRHKKVSEKNIEKFIGVQLSYMTQHHTTYRNTKHEILHWRSPTKLHDLAEAKSARARERIWNFNNPAVESLATLNLLIGNEWLVVGLFGLSRSSRCESRCVAWGEGKNGTTTEKERINKHTLEHF